MILSGIFFGIPLKTSHWKPCFPGILWFTSCARMRLGKFTSFDANYGLYSFALVFVSLKYWISITTTIEHICENIHVCIVWDASGCKAFDRKNNFLQFWCLLHYWINLIWKQNNDRSNRIMEATQILLEKHYFPWLNMPCLFAYLRCIGHCWVNLFIFINPSPSFLTQ